MIENYENQIKTFKVLSLDGGGIKGLYTASLLSKIEEKTGKNVSDYFDLIAGTSTGGLIALGLASGKNAKDLVDFYEIHGKEIFPSSNCSIYRWIQTNIFEFFKQTMFWGKYGNKKLKKILIEVFGDVKMGELNNLVVIPSFNLINGIPRVFKYPHVEGGFYRENEVPIVDVGLATSAAPTYLPIHEIDNILYVDGGVWANNPSLCALVESLRFFVGDGKNYNRIEILSLPTITTPSGWNSKIRKKRSFIGWRDKLFQTSMDGQSYFADYFLKHTIKQISENSTYYRVESSRLSSEQMNVIKMDRTDKKAIKTIKALGEQDGYMLSYNQEVMNFFKELKTYNTK